MSAEILEMPDPKPRLHCVKCHAEGMAPCGCVGTTFITLAEAKARRKEFATDLYRQGKTQMQIAETLRVSRTTITADLEGLSEPDKPPRPKGGRPKGSRKPKHSRELEDAAACMMLDDGKTYAEVTTATGISEGSITKAKARVQERREARREFIESVPKADRAALERVLRKEFEETYQRKFDDEILSYVAEDWFPEVKAYIAEARKIVEKSREPMFTEEQYNALLKCTHGSPSEKTRGFATRILTMYKHVLLGFDKTKLAAFDKPCMPALSYTTRQLDALRRKVQRERSGKRRALRQPA